MASSSIATGRPLQRDGVSADRIQKPAKAKGDATTKGNAITSRPELREQAREYLVVSGGEVVFSADNMGEAWAFRKGWGVDDSVLAVVVAGRGETLPVDLGDDPSN